MTEAPAPSLPALALPAFTPVPRQKDRSNGWKPHIQLRFIEALAETGSVSAACRRVGRADHGAYLLRRHPEAESFRAAWDAALDLGVRRIEDAAMDRALYGTEEVVVQDGKTLVRRRRFNERLVMFILRNRAPERFSEGKAKGLSGIDRMELARLKTQWRKEWEREAGARQLEQEVITIESINAKIDKMAERTRRHESPRVRAAREAYEEAMALDREEDYSPYRDPGHELYIPRLTPTPPNGDDAGLAYNGPIDVPEPDAAREAEERPKGPRIRTIKDDGW